MEESKESAAAVAAVCAADGTAAAVADDATHEEEMTNEDRAVKAQGEVHRTEEELLAKHYPRYFYDKKEKYFPVDLNQYLLDKTVVPGCNAVATPSKDGRYVWLIYMNYYLRDGGVQQLGGRGGHAYDLEIVIVEVGKHKQRVSGVFYGPHSSHEHFWIRDQKDLEEILGDDGRPRVYVSGGKHASYPVSGRVVRLFGLGTDVCNKPTAHDRPLYILTEHSKHVDRIDGKFAGPKRRITRDWSVAGGSKLNKVRTRRAIPPTKQVTKELRKLKFW